MYSTKAAGFSITKIIVITLIILAVIAAACTATYFVLKEQRTASAQLFTDVFVKDISDNNTTKTFSELNSSLKTDESTAYYSWLFWSSSFSQNKVEIHTPAVNTEYSNASIDHLFSNGSEVKISYTTSASSKLVLTVIQQADGWKILNYESI
jgi:hypothetical protein